jgi:hypothetical protein
MERCFTELVVRAFADDANLGDGSNVLIFPGHEYTNELLNRQFMPNAGESSQWSKFSPAVFFRTAAQLYITSHRRSLPQGKILAVPSLLSLELDINPNFRKLRRRGEDIVRAVQLWYRLFARTVITNEGKGFVTEDAVSKDAKRPPRNQGSSEAVWNVTAGDLSKPIFTAVYTADLDLIINELHGGKIKIEEAVNKLKIMRDRAEEPVVRRRPIPGTLPNDKIMYTALMGLAIVGSPPTAMTLSDSRLMNLPRPLSPANTHKIRVSKKRIITMLKFLGLIEDNVEGRDLTTMIDYLWQEAVDYGMPEDYNTTNGELGLDGDEMELGILRWMFSGIEANQPTWFERFCMPCKPARQPPTRDHPIHEAKLRRTNGELVKHDALTCLLCRDVTGCPLSDGVEEEVENGEGSVKFPTAHSNESQTIQLNFPPVGLANRFHMRLESPFDEGGDDSTNVEIQLVKASTN